jgi:cell division protein FtsN
VPVQAEPAQPAARGYVVQVSVRRTKAEAEASFRSLQSKFPRQLGGRTATIERADLGAKGTYYRTMVGPFASAGAADQFCSSLKAAGGQCVIQRE